MNDMAEATAELQPLTVHGSNISYFTGKLENYFRVRGIPYTLKSMQFPAAQDELKRTIGVMQMPALELGDGRWMTDTTAIIQWFEARYPDAGVIPPDPVQAYLSLLIEDWADEWWWRPAMHYRWYYPEGAALQSRHLTEELMRDARGPEWVKRAVLRRRQRRGYTMGDGLTDRAIPGVEAAYLSLLDWLEDIFSQRPFLFGDRPGLADIGLSGPFFRHFALDPVPLAILRRRAPAVLEWVARLWNWRPDTRTGEWLEGVPADLSPLLDNIGEAYLPYLCANAEAVAAGRKRFDVRVGGVSYYGARSSRYRVWCLSMLRSWYEGLPGDARDETREHLERHGCWEPLWRTSELPLLPGQESGLPFHASTKMLWVNE